MINNYEEIKKVVIEIRALCNLMKRKRERVSMLEDGREITELQRYVLYFLFTNIGVKDTFQRDIEQNFEIRRSTATQLLQLMEKNGLITRVSVDYDGRMKKIILSDSAKNNRSLITTELKSSDEILLENVSEEELEIFFGVLAKMKANLSK